MCARLRAREQALQACLAFGQHELAQIFAVREQQVEDEEYERVALAVRKRCLQRREVRRAVAAERHDLAVDQAIGQGLRLAHDRVEFLRPVETLARAQHRAAVRDAQLHAVAVELDLMAPSLAVGRPGDELGEFRLHEAGRFGGFCHL